jgi:uncharacterized repeat protein (TIGR01451 family)
VGQDVFLVPEQEMAPNGLMNSLGRAWAPVLSNFVTRGGVVIVCSYARDEHLLLDQGGLIHLKRLRDFPQLDLDAPSPQPLTEGITESFRGLEVSTYETTNGNVVLRSSAGDAVVVARPMGRGLAVMIGTDFPANRTAFDRIIANAVRLAQTPVTAPATVFPSVGGYFVNGVWNGQLALPEPASRVTVRADDFAGHTGTSPPFAVVAPNDLVVSVADSPDPALVGGLITNRVTVRNTGPAAATGVTLRAGLSPDATFVSDSLPSGRCTLTAGVLDCALGSIAGGETVEAAWVWQGRRAGRITNTVQVAAPGVDPYPENNSARTITRLSYPSLGVFDAFTGEGQGAMLSFAINLIPPSSQIVSCDYFTSDASAVAGEDYDARRGTVVFQPGETNQFVQVPVREDSISEGGQLLFLNLTNATNAILLRRVGSGAINDNDATPTLALGDASVTEGPFGEVTSLEFHLRLSFASGQSVTVRYATADGTAQVGRDYTAASGTVVFPPGVTEQSIQVSVLGDNESESNETVLVNLSNPVNAGLGNARGVGTIWDDDAGRVEQFSWSPVGATQFVGVPFAVVVTARDGFGQPVTGFQGTVPLAAVAGGGEFSIGAGTESWEFPLGTYYHDARLQTICLQRDIGPPALLTGLSLLVLVAPGQTLSNWTVRLKHTAQDQFTHAAWDSQGWTTVYERDEVISAPGWVTFPFREPFAFNGRDHLLVDLSFNNATFSTEAFCASTPLSEARTLALRSDSAFGDPRGWTGTVPPPTALRRIPTLRLLTEDRVLLDPPAAATFVNGVWTGTLTIRETATGLRLRASDSQGHAGTSSSFNVSALNDISVRISTSATAPTLGETLVQSIVVTNSGPSSATGVTVTSRLPPELNFVAASAAGGCARAADSVICSIGTLAGASASTVTVTSVVTQTGLATNRVTVERAEPDGYPPNNQAENVVTLGPTRLVVEDASVTEGDSGSIPLVFTVRLAAPAPTPVTVNYFTASGSASNAIDLIATNGTIEFPPGTTLRLLPVSVLGDVMDEGNESFSLVLTNASNAFISRPVAIGTILDDDPPPSVSISNATVLEGDSGVTSLRFPVQLSAPSAFSVTVRVAVSNGTALVGQDFFAPAVTFFFPPGLASRSLTIPLVADRVPEPDETFTVTLFNPVNATLARSSATGTILNDDGLPGVLDRLEWAPVPSSQRVDVPFPVTVLARDFFDRPATNFSGAVKLSARVGPPDAVVGAGNVSQPFPLGTGYRTARAQSIFLAGELGGARSFTALALDVILPPGQALPAFTVRMKHTRLASYATNAWEAAGWTTVFQGSLEPAGPGLLVLPLTPPFAYNGTDHLMIDFSFNHPYYTSDGLCRWTATNASRTLLLQTDGPLDPLLWSGTDPAPTPVAQFPNLRLVSGYDVPVTPTVSGDFTEGSWMGQMQVRAPATGLVLRAEDALGHVALSELISVLAVETDSDHDGLPDAWEMTHFGNLLHGPQDDPDGDGVPNLAEYQAGTNPTDPTSAFVLTEARVSGADVLLRLRTVAGRRYVVEHTSDLDQGLWLPLEISITGTGGIVEVLDAGGGGQGTRLYRVRQAP